jgi:hypothetical protein
MILFLKILILNMGFIVAFCDVDFLANTPSSRLLQVVYLAYGRSSATIQFWDKICTFNELFMSNILKTISRMRNPSKENPTYLDFDVDIGCLFESTNEVYNRYATILNNTYDNLELSQEEFYFLEKIKTKTRCNYFLLIDMAKMIVRDFELNEKSISEKRGILSCLSSIDSLVKIYVKADEIIRNTYGMQLELTAKLYDKYRKFWEAIEINRAKVYKDAYNQLSEKYRLVNEKMPPKLVLINDLEIGLSEDDLPEGI